MFDSVLKSLRASWKPLVVTDLVFKVVAFVVLTPLLSLLFRAFLAVSGRTILADADIARFLLHPLGWLAFVFVVGAAIGILALEQASLMAIALAAGHGRSFGVREALRFVAGKAVGVLRITCRMAARILLLAAPFLAVGGTVYWLLLTDRDINFYLANKPAKFWWAVGSIGMVLLALAVLIVRCIVNWSVAIQLHLFEDTPARECLSASRERVNGHRRTIAKWIVVWWLLCTIVGNAASGLVLWIGEWLIPDVVNSLSRLVVALGCLLLVLGVVNVALNLLAVISFAVLQLQVYERFARTEACRIPGSSGSVSTRGFQWTRGRLISGLVLSLLAAATIGAVAVRTIRLEDDVEITAHRGGAALAPENTLAAIARAIEEQADWVEIDVQESLDGVVVVIHDSDLSRVAGVDLKIWEATAEQLRSHDIGSYFDPSLAGERVPTLEEVLEACRGRIGVNIELKYYRHNVALEQKVIDLVEEFDMADEVVVMSLEARLIANVKRLRPQWTVGLLTAVSAGDLTRADADFLAVSASLATRRFVQRSHDREKEVYAWTLNDAAALSTMISRGVDNLITDHPDLARRVIAERAALSPTDRILIELATRFGIVPTNVAEQ